MREKSGDSGFIPEETIKRAARDPKVQSTIDMLGRSAARNVDDILPQLNIAQRMAVLRWADENNIALMGNADKERIGGTEKIDEIINQIEQWVADADKGTYNAEAEMLRSSLDGLGTLIQRVVYTEVGNIAAQEAVRAMKALPLGTRGVLTAKFWKKFPALQLGFIRKVNTEQRRSILNKQRIYDREGKIVEGEREGANVVTDVRGQEQTSGSGTTPQQFVEGKVYSFRDKATGKIVKMKRVSGGWLPADEAGEKKMSPQ